MKYWLLTVDGFGDLLKPKSNGWRLRSKDNALCPEIFASSWGLRKEHYTGGVAVASRGFSSDEKRWRLDHFGIFWDDKMWNSPWNSHGISD